MAKNLGTLTVWLTANDDGLKKGFTSAARQVEQWKSSALAGATVASAAITAFAYTSVNAFMEAEQASIDLENAISNTGDSALRYVPHFKNFAAQIQNVTKYEDDAVISTMAYGKNLGIQTNQLEEATRAAIGLAEKYKLDLNSAMMLVGRAFQGQTQMLARYGIVIEEGLSDQEKFNQLLKIGASNFGLAEKAAGSLQGRLAQARNAWNDFQEMIGETIIKSLNITENLKGLTIGIKSMSDSFSGANPALKDFAVYSGAAIVGITGIGVALKAANFTGAFSILKIMGTGVARFGTSVGLATMAVNGLGTKLMESVMFARTATGLYYGMAAAMGAIATATAAAGVAIGYGIGSIKPVKDYIASIGLVEQMAGVHDAEAKSAEVDAKLHKLNQEREKRKKDMAESAAKIAEEEAAPAAYGNARIGGKYGDEKKYQEMEDEFRKRQKEAQAEYDKKRKDMIFDAMTNEEKINELYRRRVQLASELDGYVGAEKYEKMSELVDIEKQIGDLKQRKPDVRNESSVVGAVARGSAEALRLERSGITKDDAVAKNTKTTADYVKKLYDAVSNLGNTGNVGEYETEVAI